MSDTGKVNRIFNDIFDKLELYNNLKLVDKKL